MVVRKIAAILTIEIGLCEGIAGIVQILVCQLAIAFLKTILPWSNSARAEVGKRLCTVNRMIFAAEIMQQRPGEEHSDMRCPGFR